uniref:Gamma-glutamylcyclotransferase family protein n=1 Tax=Macrostomum lignano TaxID=282301 RepID=A0A1I8JPB3_9PLAT
METQQQQPQQHQPLIIFTYGTLKSDLPNGFRMQQIGAKLLGTAKTVKPYPLVIASEYNIPALLDYPGRGHRVQGELYAVRDSTRVDEFEGHPEQYRRAKIVVELIELAKTPGAESEFGAGIGGSGSIECDCYFLQRPREHLLLLPTVPRYYDGVLGLPFMPRIIGRRQRHQPASRDHGSNAAS